MKRDKNYSPLDLAERLLACRLEYSISIRRFAQLAKVSTATVVKAEARKPELSPMVVHKLYRTIYQIEKECSK